MYCPECGRVIPDQAPFCGYCGCTVPGADPSGGRSQSRRSPAKRAIIIGAIAALIVTDVILLGLCWHSMKSRKRGEETGDIAYAFRIDDCSWPEAFDAAKAAGGRLAAFDSREEYDAVTAQLDARGLRGTEFRIGARRDEGGTDYRWVDETGALTGDVLNDPKSWAYPLWHDGEPSFRWKENEETCVVLYYDEGAGRWGLNDIPDAHYTSNDGRYGYIAAFDTEEAARAFEAEAEEQGDAPAVTGEAEGSGDQSEAPAVTGEAEGSGDQSEAPAVTGEAEESGEQSEAPDTQAPAEAPAEESEPEEQPAAAFSEEQLYAAAQSLGDVALWEYHDYDGDGSYEAYFLTVHDGPGGHGIDNIYFIGSDGSVTNMAQRNNMYYYDSNDGYYRECQGKGFFWTDYGIYGSSHRTFLFSVRSGVPYELELSQDIQGFMYGDGIFSTTIDDYSSGIHMRPIYELLYDAQTQQFLMGGKIGG